MPPGDPCVLVVDASSETRRRLCGLLDESGIARVEGWAPRAEQVLARLAEDPAPDCVVIDVPLHDGRGVELVESVRRARSDLLLIAVDGHGEHAIQERVRAAGADHCLSKAHEFERVVQLVRRHGLAHVAGGAP